MSTIFTNGCPAVNSALLAHGRARGFSLVEMMIVLVIVAVLLSIAVPSYSVLAFRTKLKSYTNELVTSVYLARGEAIKRNAPMTMCIGTVDEVDGTGDCLGSGDWEQGWIVMDQDDVVIRHQQALPSGLKIFEESGLQTIAFQSSGILTPSVTMTICQAVPEEGVEEKKVTISPTGRPRVETFAKGDPGSTGCSP